VAVWTVGVGHANAAGASIRTKAANATSANAGSEANLFFMGGLQIPRVDWGRLRESELSQSAKTSKAGAERRMRRA